MGVVVRPLGPDDGDWLAGQLRERWSDVHVARLGELVDASARPALVAELDGVAAGFVTLDVVGTECEVLTIDAFVPWAGVGTALIRASEEYARDHGCDRLWLVTTNDNLPALRSTSGAACGSSSCGPGRWPRPVASSRRSPRSGTWASRSTTSSCSNGASRSSSGPAHRDRYTGRSPSARSSTDRASDYGSEG